MPTIGHSWLHRQCSLSSEVSGFVIYRVAEFSQLTCSESIKSCKSRIFLRCQKRQQNSLRTPDSRKNLLELSSFLMGTTDHHDKTPCRQCQVASFWSSNLMPMGVAKVSLPHQAFVPGVQSCTMIWFPFGLLLRAEKAKGNAGIPRTISVVKAAQEWTTGD